MKLYQLFEARRYVKNPFPQSHEKRVLFHGTDKQFETFNRVAHGIYATPEADWAKSHYGNNVVAFYANVKNMLRMEWDDPRSDFFYDMDYENVAKVLAELSAQGYDCCMFGGESESLVLFNDVELVNAVTGKPM